MSMVHQFGKQLPRPVQVWVLDTVPGDVWCEAGDHPRDTIAYARTIPMPIANRKALVDSLTGAGFTLEGAQWMTTNLTPAPGATAGELTWVFDIEGIVAMYQSYEATDLWPMLETQPIGLSVDFVPRGAIGVCVGRRGRRADRRVRGQGALPREQLALGAHRQPGRPAGDPRAVVRAKEVTLEKGASRLCESRRHVSTE